THLSVRELQRFHELGLGHFVRRAFDHDYVVFGADINEVEVTLGALRVRRVGDELPVDAANRNGGDWTGKWNVRHAKRGGGPVERQNVGIIFAVGAEQDRDDLGVVKVSLWK